MEPQTIIGPLLCDLAAWSFKKAKPDKLEPNRGVGTAFHVDTVCPHHVDRMRGLCPRLARQQRSTWAKRPPHRLVQPHVKIAHDDKDCRGLTASEDTGPDTINV